MTKSVAEVNCLNLVSSMHTKSPCLFPPVEDDVAVEGSTAGISEVGVDETGAVTDGSLLLEELTPAAANLANLSASVSQLAEVPGLLTNGKT